MKTLLLNKNWRFHLGDEENAYETVHDDTAWQSVTIPHDWSVAYPKSRAYSSGTGYVTGGTAWYRKAFTLSEDDRGHAFFLVFDGVYKNSQVWINGYYLGRRPNGYVSFRYEVSDFLYFDGRENVIALKVTHEDIADSRWFTGSGITRKVTLVRYDFAYPTEYGVFFRTEEAGDERAVFTCECELRLHTGASRDEEMQVQAILFDADGAAVAEGARYGILSPLEARTVCLCAELAKPRLWSPDSPYLYTLRVVVTDSEGGSCTVDEEKVGLRTFAFDPDRGFFLNGVPTVFKGVCMHHDGGALGAAMTKGVWRRRLRLLKAMGCNAIRMSHNPQMPELYDLCDEIGFLVMDEAFDEWEGCKNKWYQGHNVYPPKHQGYAEDFPEWHERDLISMVRRDRNHPSVILWSIGNEIDYPNDPYNHPSFLEMTGNNDHNKPAAERMYHPGRPNTERLTVLARELASIVKKQDPSRPVTSAVSFPELSANIGFYGPLDVIGYNYKEALYAKDHARFPDKPILGSENSHSYAAWKAVTDHDYISGQFLWTGIDFLGECSGWPVHSSAAGLMTTAGFEKPQYYLRKSWWSDEPCIYLCTARAAKAAENREWKPMTESWNYVPGEMIEVRCYTNAGVPTLRLNGGEITGGTYADGFYSWVLPFAEGRLEAEAAGIRCALESTGAAARIELRDVSAPDEDLVQIELRVLDTQGRPVVTDQSRIHITLDGAYEYLGMDNGDIEDLTDYRDLRRNTLDGRLMIYFRKLDDAPVHLLAGARHLAPAEITI